MTSTTTPVHILSHRNTDGNSSPSTAHFDFKNHVIRTELDAGGNPWFAAADVCAALDIKNSRQALAKLDHDEKGVISSDTLGGIQTISTVNESGLYELIFSSRKPEAKAFKRWIKQTVLPALRKDGMYIAGEENLFSNCRTDDEVSARLAEVSTLLHHMSVAKLTQLAAERSRINREERDAYRAALASISRNPRRRNRRRRPSNRLPYDYVG